MAAIPVSAPGRRQRRARPGAALLATPSLALGVLVAQVFIASRSERLPEGPSYTVDLTIAPIGQSFEQTPEPAIELVMLGDSTVAGMGSPSEAESLPALIAQRVADRLGHAVHVVGYGVSGARTDEVTIDQVPRLLDARADVVGVVIGSNDVTHLTPIWEMQQRTEALLGAVREQADAPIVLGGIPQFRTVPRLQQPLRWVAGTYANLLREPQRAAASSFGEGVRYVDIAAEASPRFVGRPEMMSADGYHPSAVGYGLWADALAPAVCDAVKETVAGVSG
jgi:lysophospholipase L1-like esterase